MQSWELQQVLLSKSPVTLCHCWQADNDVPVIYRNLTGFHELWGNSLSCPRGQSSDIINRKGLFSKVYTNGFETIYTHRCNYKSRSAFFSFYDRFGVIQRLELYNCEQLTDIIRRVYDSRNTVHLTVQIELAEQEVSENRKQEPQTCARFCRCNGKRRNYKGNRHNCSRTTFEIMPARSW